MAQAEGWGVHNPNTQHQLWSKWVFTVAEGGQHPPFAVVRDNFARWARLGFGSVGQVKVEETLRGYTMTLIVEGAPAHDPAYVSSVDRAFDRDFVTKGFGRFALGAVSARVLAGDQQDGRPRAQMLVLPTIDLHD